MNWVMMVYKLPKAKTTAIKVSVWRKLKKLGVYPLQDSVCILPHSERTLESFEWLAEEIKELGGEATLWETSALNQGQEIVIRDYFLEQVNKQYKEIINDAANVTTVKDIQNLWAAFNRVRSQDYLRSPLWIEARGLLERTAQRLSGKDE